MIARRDALRAAAALPLAALGTPAVAQGVAANRTLRFIPHADLSSIDPIGTTGYVVRNHGYMVFDTLYSLDANFRPRPQMAEGHDIADDGRTVTIRLRDNLRFHDGEPVRAADCVASIRRWSARHGMGQTIMATTDELTAVDDRTLRFRLKAPFPLLLEAIGSPSSPVCFMMPERLASIAPTTPIREAIGSGPFRFLQNEWVPGSRAAYARNEAYVPRGEAPDGAAGGKHVHFDRVEWLTIPDAGTAAAAIQRGEVDWLEQPQGDLLPLLARNRDIDLTPYDPLGSVVLLRFNHLHPPFDNPAIRRAVLAAVNQRDYMTAVAGDPSRIRDCRAFFPCGTPMSTGAGGEAMVANLDRARAMLREAGYAGQRVTVISPTDLAPVHAAGLVTEDLLKRLGMNVEFVATDWGSVLARRGSFEPADRGGWSIFHTTAVAIEFMSPASHLALRGHGRAAWPGWPTNPRIEALRLEWIAAATPDAQRAVAARMEAEAFDAVPYVPLGQYEMATAVRRNVTGMLRASAPYVWNMRKT